MENIIKLSMHTEEIATFVNKMLDGVDPSKSSKQLLVLKAAALISKKINYDQSVFINSFMSECRSIESKYLEELNKKLDEIFTEPSKPQEIDAQVQKISDEPSKNSLGSHLSSGSK